MLGENSCIRTFRGDVMGRYEAWLKRKENATSYANEAVCQRCRYGEWVRTRAFCHGRERVRVLTAKEWDDTKPGFCPEYKPKDLNETGDNVDCGMVTNWRLFGDI